MLETAIVYLLVIAAAAWVGWAILLPRRMRRALAARLGRKPAAAGAPKDCSCGGGGCGD